MNQDKPLVNKVLKKDAKDYWEKRAKKLINVKLSPGKVKEVRNIARGVMSPLEGFARFDEAKSVAFQLKLLDGNVWPIPIMCPIPEETYKKLHIGRRLALVDEKNNPIALLFVEDMYKLPNIEKTKFAREIFKTDETDHPGVEAFYKESNYYVGGEVWLIDDNRDPFPDYNLTPAETRFLFKKLGWKKIAGFQTRNAPHRGHEAVIKSSLAVCDGVLIHPVIGKKKKGDFLDNVIIGAYQELIKNYFPKNSAVFSILPLRMRYAGPREAVFHALVRKNFGCTHLIVGRDHAGVGDYYGTYEAQEIFELLPEDIGVEIIKINEAFYCKKCGDMTLSKLCPHDDKHLVKPSGTFIRGQLTEGKQVPKEMMRKEVLKYILAQKGKIFVE